MFDNAQNQGILSRPFRDDFSVMFTDCSDFLGIPRKVPSSHTLESEEATILLKDSPPQLRPRQTWNARLDGRLDGWDGIPRALGKDLCGTRGQINPSSPAVSDINGTLNLYNSALIQRLFPRSLVNKGICYRTPIT